LAVDSLDNKIPIKRARNRGGCYLPNLRIKWRTTREVSRRRSAKTVPRTWVRLLKE
jgi:hypothetical protein